MRIRIAEQQALPADRQLDKANRIARGVLILRPLTQNGARNYTRPARESLARLICETKPRVYLNHRTSGLSRNRDVTKMVGYLEAGRLESDEAVRADFRYTVTAQKQIEDLFENLTEQAGFSIDATGLSGEDENGREQVVDLTELHGVDLVAQGGHGSGLFEAMDQANNVDRCVDYINVNAEKERDTSILNQYREAAGLQPVADSTPAEREDAALVAEYLESAGIKPKAKEPPEGAKDYLEAMTS